MEILTWVLLAIMVVGVFYAVNRFAFHYAGSDFKKRLWAGMLFVFSTPLFMFALSMGIQLLDKGEGLAGTIGVLASVPYFVNGLVVFLSAFRLVKPSEIVGND
ncbi:hypothetical protein [Pontibacillus chungwhensis]|uniref:hypothetical protein n=1 Tax=Pontibacillus chungwhensis TaxID=265426 RepID=UPI000A7CD03D|nr:hypothetical protein [Pontibacillus chungwhensis]